MMGCIARVVAGREVVQDIEGIGKHCTPTEQKEKPWLSISTRAFRIPLPGDSCGGVKKR